VGQGVGEQLVARLHGQSAVAGSQAHHAPVLLEAASGVAEREVGGVVAGHLGRRHGRRRPVLPRALAQTAHVADGLRGRGRLRGGSGAHGDRLEPRSDDGALTGAPLGARGAALSVGDRLGVRVGNGWREDSVAQVVESVVVDRAPHVLDRLLGIGRGDDFKLPVGGLAGGQYTYLTTSHLLLVDGHGLKWFDVSQKTTGEESRRIEPISMRTS